MTMREATRRSYSWDDSFLRRDDGRPIPTTTLLAPGMGLGAHGSLVSTSTSSSSTSLSPTHRHAHQGTVPRRRQEHHQQQPNSTSPVLLRTNFGKNSVYRPPMVAGWNQHFSPTNRGTTTRDRERERERERTNDRERGGYHSEVSQEDSDVPFDQQRRGKLSHSNGNSSSNRGGEIMGTKAGDSRPFLPDLSSRPRKFRPTSSLSPPNSNYLSSSSVATTDLPFDETISLQSLQSETETADAAAKALLTTLTPALQMSLIAEIRRADKSSNRNNNKLQDLRNPDESPDDGDSSGRRDTTFADDVEEDDILARDRTTYHHSDDEFYPKNNNNYYDDDADGESIRRRYRMLPPRISDPVLVTFPPSNGGTPTAAETTTTTMAFLTPREEISSAPTSNTSGGLSSALAGDGVLPRLYDHNNNSILPVPLSLSPASPSPTKRRQQVLAGKSKSTRSNHNGRDQPDNEDDDNDSIFDFEDVETSRRRKAKKWRNSRRAATAYASTTTTTTTTTDAGDTDDDDVDEDEDPALTGGATGGAGTTLTERAQAAWKRKSAQRAARFKDQKQKQQQDLSPPESSGEEEDEEERESLTQPLSSSSRGLQEDQDSPGPAVHFSKMKDTIHHFEPDPDEATDNFTVGGRSLNSEYTKSAESEVEDFIKDLLMIGSGKGNNPGRRKIKYNPQIKRKLKQKQAQQQQQQLKQAQQRRASMTDDDQDEESGTLETYDEDMVAAPCTLAKSEVDFLGQYRPNSSGLFCAAEGLAESTKHNTSDPLVNVWNYIEGGLNAVTSVLGFDDGSSIPRKNQQEKQKQKNQQPRAQPRSASASKAVASSSSSRKKSQKLSPAPSSPESHQDSASSSPEGFFDNMMQDNESPVIVLRRSRDIDNERAIKSAPSLEEDVRLVDLAVQAARSMHRLRGYEYDESNEIDIGTDVKFSVVDLRLPLGLIFQENETGCWVTKVLPDGSAAQSKYVAAGDQLAAIDGLSAIQMNVDQIAGLIRRKNSDVELTFLRYVGPLCPAQGDVAEEGYEVKMQTRFESPPRMAHHGRCGVLGGSMMNHGASSKRHLSTFKVVGNAARLVSTGTPNHNNNNNTTPANAAKDNRKRFWRFGKKK